MFIHGKDFFDLVARYLRDTAVHDLNKLTVPVLPAGIGIGIDKRESQSVLLIISAARLKSA